MSLFEADELCLALRTELMKTVDNDGLPRLCYYEAFGSGATTGGESKMVELLSKHGFVVSIETYNHKLRLMLALLDTF